jgi:hypothetical protein
MRWGVLALLGCGALAAQTPPTAVPAPLLTARGVVLERDTAIAGGEFSIRLDSFEVLRYKFDANTRVQRDAYPISIPALHPGEQVEVSSDAVAGSLLRYARTVRVVVDLKQQAYRSRRHTPDFGELFGASDPLFARGDMALSGVVARIQPGRLVLHTHDGERTILLRDDTRYLENGEVATAAALRPNLHVFVRAGRNLYDEVEGYQVVWGSILEPK